MSGTDVLRYHKVHKEFCDILIDKKVLSTTNQKYMQEDEKFLHCLPVPRPRRTAKTKAIQLRYASGGGNPVTATFQVEYKPAGVLWRIFEKLSMH